MKLILVRHGESGNNALGIHNGPETTLTETGVRQAAAVAKKLASEHIDAIFSSDWPRAVQTAQAIAQAHQNLEVVQDPRLRERDNGEWVGKAKGIYEEEADRQGIDAHFLRAPGGSSLADVFENSLNFFYEIQQRFRNKTVVVVAHGNPIAALLLNIHNLPRERYKEFWVGNASITIIDWKHDAARILALDAREHLA